jgi:hypothetical protein
MLSRCSSRCAEPWDARCPPAANWLARRISPHSFANMPQNPSPEPKETISKFERLLADLARAEVDFAVVGGLAVILNGYPRLTLDADILVSDALRIFTGFSAVWNGGAMVGRVSYGWRTLPRKKGQFASPRSSIWMSSPECAASLWTGFVRDWVISTPAALAFLILRRRI